MTYPIDTCLHYYCLQMFTHKSLSSFNKNPLKKIGHWNNCMLILGAAAGFIYSLKKTRALNNVTVKNQRDDVLTSRHNQERTNNSDKHRHSVTNVEI